MEQTRFAIRIVLREQAKEYAALDQVAACGLALAPYLPVDVDADLGVPRVEQALKDRTAQRNDAVVDLNHAGEATCGISQKHFVSVVAIAKRDIAMLHCNSQLAA